MAIDAVPSFGESRLVRSIEPSSKGDAARAIYEWTSLRSRLRAHEHRRAVHAHRALQHLDDALGAHRVRDVDGHAHSGAIVDDCQALDVLTGGGCVKDEVVHLHLKR